MDAAAWDERYAQRELVWTAEPNRFLVEEVAGMAPGRALDLACGEGRNTVWLAEQGWQATGVDFSGRAIEKAQALADARNVAAQWEVHDLSRYTPTAGAFDLVVMLYLQVSAAVRRVAVAGAVAALAPGGVFLLIAHDSTNVDEGYGGPQDPAVLYTAEGVVSDLQGQLVVERAERVGRSVDTPDGERVALDALVRARKPS